MSRFESESPRAQDPAFANDGESFRVARQIFEGLVGTKPGTADPAPLLAAMQAAIRKDLNPLFKIQRVEPVPALPRTASNKVMRRLLRSQPGGQP